MIVTMVWVLAQRCDFPSAFSAVPIEQFRACNSVLRHRLQRLCIVELCAAVGEQPTH